MSEMDYNQARFNMVEQQVRPWDVLDPRVLNVIGNIPRELFTPESCKNLAYADTSIPLGVFQDHESHMMNPVVEGRLLQALRLSDDDVVLEIGTGSGYLTACLASLARHVDSVDIDPAMTTMAEKNLAKLEISNVNLSTGDASSGWDQKQFYDAIAITGSMQRIPEFYKKALKNGGRLFVITGDAPVMKAQLVTRLSKTEWVVDDLFETCIDPLINAEKPSEFVF